MRERAASLQRTLADRAAQEQRAIRFILTELKEHILKELHQPEVVQLTLTGFSSEGHQQFDRIFRCWSGALSRSTARSLRKSRAESSVSPARSRDSFRRL
jgi:hypothetical protein